MWGMKLTHSLQHAQDELSFLSMLSVPQLLSLTPLLSMQPQGRHATSSVQCVRSSAVLALAYRHARSSVEAQQF